jgi:hypothetical protein
MYKDYIVDVEYITSEVKTFRVAANNHAEAEIKALQMADAVAWKEPHGQYEILSNMSEEEFNGKDV